MTVARKNLGPRLLAGQLKPRPGMYGTPRAVSPDPGVMGTPEAVRRVAELTAGEDGMNFYEAFREVMEKMERGE